MNLHQPEGWTLPFRWTHIGNSLPMGIYGDKAIHSELNYQAVHGYQINLKTDKIITRDNHDGVGLKGDLNLTTALQGQKHMHISGLIYAAMLEDGLIRIGTNLG